MVHTITRWALRALGACASSLLALGLTAAPAQSVDVVQTNADQSKLLENRPATSFAAQPLLPLAIRVDDGIRYQTMDGFGASFTDSSAWLVWTQLTPVQREALLQDLFSARGIRLSFLRQPMGATDLALGDYSYDDMPRGQRDPDLANFSIAHDTAYVLPVLRRALALNPDVRVMALPWSPPGWMKANDSMHGGSFDSKNFAALADYFVEFIRGYRANGVPVDFVAAQNEPLFAGWGYPTEFLTEAQEAEFIGEHLGPALREARLRTQIIGYDHNWDNSLYALSLLRSRSAARYLAGVSFHCYAGDRALAQEAVHEFFPHAGIWFTECTGITSAPVFGDNLASNMHDLIIGATRNWARSVVLWNVALDQNSGPRNGSGCSNCRGVVTVDTSTSPATVRYEVEYYALGHASKFTVPGAARIDSNFAGPIENVAFKNPDGSIALLAYNSDGTNSRSFSVAWRGQSFDYTLPPGAVATFRWNTVSGRDFDLAVSPAAQTVAAGDDVHFELATHRYRGLRGAVRLSVRSLPAGVSADIDDDRNRDRDVGAARLRLRTSRATPPGTYPITITGRGGALVRTATARLIVGTPLTPYGRTPWTIPGRIEAESFDLGGEGIAYHDTDAGNNGGEYRSEGVDIESASDTGGGYDIGETNPGEWLKYTADVTQSGLYTLSARVASQGSGRSFHVEVDGRDVTGTMFVPDTGGWQSWRTIASPRFRLAAGPHVLRLTFESGGGNINWIELEPTVPSTPLSGTPIAVPGIIQAEDFDLGGEGVAYHDENPRNDGGQYRANEGVDIEGTNDTGGGYDVGWVGAGEWLNYTIDVAQDGRYTVHARVGAMAPGGSFHLAVDGRRASPSATVPGTDGWQIWKTVDIPDVWLPAGQHVLQVIVDGAGFWGNVGSLNWLSIEPNPPEPRRGWFRGFWHIP